MRPRIWAGSAEAPITAIAAGRKNGARSRAGISYFSRNACRYAPTHMAKYSGRRSEGYLGIVGIQKFYRHVWMAPAWQGIFCTQVGMWRPVAVMCAAFGCGT